MSVYHYHLIRDIFNATPVRDRALNFEGEHVIAVKGCKVPTNATLEKMTIDKLRSLARMLCVKISHKELA